MHGIMRRREDGFVLIECYTCGQQAWRHWGIMLKVRRCAVRILGAKAVLARSEALSAKIAAERELMKKTEEWERKRRL